MKYRIFKIVSILIVMVLALHPASIALAQDSSPPAQVEPLAIIPRVWIPLIQGGGQGTPEPPPPTGIVSDEFNYVSNFSTGPWTAVNPSGESTIRADGSYARITIPAGKPQIVWRTGYTSSQAPRIVQNVNDPSSFTITARFDTRPRGTYTGHGIWIEHDANDFIRFEIFSYAANDIYLHANTILNGQITSPAVYDTQLIGFYEDSADVTSYLRIKRSGSTYTIAYSGNGTTWITVKEFQFTPSVAKVGLYASTSYLFGGQPNEAPAFDMKADYFRVTIP